MTCPICGGRTVNMPPHPEGDIRRCVECTHAFTVPGSVSKPETYAASYFLRDHRRWFENPDVGLFARVLAQIASGASVIDVGCGRGDFLRFARRKRPDLDLTGIDVAPNEMTEGIRFIQGDILKDQLHDRFDAVVSFQVIEHVTDAHELLDRLLELARPGGIVLVATPNSASTLYSAAKFGRKVGFHLPFNRLYSSHHLHHFTRRSLSRLFAMHGCRVEQHWDHNAPIKAMDLPVSSKVADVILRGGLCVLWGTGRVLRRSYLQTVICRATRPPIKTVPSRSGPADAIGLL